MASSNEVGKGVEEEDPFYLEKYVRPGIAARVPALGMKQTGLAQSDKNGNNPGEDDAGESIHVENRDTKSQQRPITPTTVPTPPTPPNTASRGRSVSIPSGGDLNLSRSPETNALRDFRKVVSSRIKMCTVAKWVRNVPLSAPLERSPSSSHNVAEYSISHGSDLSAGFSLGNCDSRYSPKRQQIRWTDDEHPRASKEDSDFLSSSRLERSQAFEQTEGSPSPRDQQSVIRPGGSVISQGVQPSSAKVASNQTKTGLQKASKSLDAGCSTSCPEHAVAL